MADTFKTCAVDGCNGNSALKHGCKGLCPMHYKRLLRHGDPTKGRTPNGAKEAFLLAYASHQGEECLIWPFPRKSDGRAYVRWQGVGTYAARVMCILAHGDAPPGLDAAHTCGKGHEGCVNPKHLRWSDKSANQMDRVEHGTSNRGIRNGHAKLCESDVRAIREMDKNGQANKSIAEIYGVSRATIQDIVSRRNWGWLD